MRIQKNVRDVAITLSPEQYEALVASGNAPRVNRWS